jgi:hypothetical protein
MLRKREQGRGGCASCRRSNHQYVFLIMLLLRDSHTLRVVVMVSVVLIGEAPCTLFSLAREIQKLCFAPLMMGRCLLLLTLSRRCIGHYSLLSSMATVGRLDIVTDLMVPTSLRRLIRIVGRCLLCCGSDEMLLDSRFLKREFGCLGIR